MESRSPGDAMTKRLLLVGLGVLTAVVVVLLIETFIGHVIWCTIVPGARVEIDSVEAKGWLHRAGEDYWILTVVGDARESYLIVPPGSRSSGVSHCGGWTAPHFPLFIITDYGQPCVNVVRPTGAGGVRDLGLLDEQAWWSSQGTKAGE